MRDVLLLIGGSSLLLQPLSALLGVGALWGLGRIPAAAAPMSGISWWMGNVLGQCIVAPVVLVLSKPSKTWLPWPLLTTGLLVLLGLLGFGMLGGSGLPSFALALFFPLVVFMAVGFGVEGGALAGLGLSAVAVGITSLGQGPFRSSWVEVGLFLVRGILTGLILGALFTERRRMEGKLREQNETLGQTNAKLSQALEEVQTLAGLLPICAYCKHIRDDKGYWNGIEDYLAQHAQLHFTHGICPDCR